MSDVASTVKEIIVEKLGVKESEVTPEANFTNDLGADSLDTVEMFLSVKQMHVKLIFQPHDGFGKR